MDRQVSQRPSYISDDKFEELKLSVPKLEELVRELTEWSEDKKPSLPMTSDAVVRLEEYFRKIKADFSSVATGIYSPDDLMTVTLHDFMTAPDDTYEAIPEIIRNHINTNYLLPSKCWHQMFGKGVSIQADAEFEHMGDHMLLQLCYDDIMHWRFGDLGAFQFWISPEDLQERNWQAVTLSFEGS